MQNVSKNEEAYALAETRVKTFTTKEVKIIKKFDPFQDPPDLEMAVEHGTAKKVYQQTKEEKYKTENQKACPCCGLSIGGKLLPLNTDLKELYYLGSGYIIYFVFIKYSVALIALLFGMSGLFNLLTNYYGNDCPSGPQNALDESCKHSFILRFALNNKRDDTKLLSAFLAVNLTSVFVIIVFFHFIRYQFRKREIDVDKETITPSDYTVELKGVSPTMSDQEIIQWLKKFENKNKPFNIVKINRTYNIDKYIELTRKKEKLMKKQTKYSNNQAKLNSIQLKIDEIEAHFDAFKKRELEPTSVVFAVFQTSAEAEYVEDKFHKGFLRKRFERLLSKFIHTYDQLAGKTITVRRAPEPTDILWENLASSTSEQIQKKILVDICTLILVAIGFGFVVLINWMQELIKNNVEHEFTMRLLSFVSSILIFLWDLMLSYIIKKLASTEKNPTLTTYYTTVSGKLSIIQLINSGFTTFFAKMIVANNFSMPLSAPLKDRLRAINIYENGGLIENMYFVFIIYAILPPILTLFDPLHLFKAWKQSRVKNKSLTLNMMQKQAHQFFEGPEVDMSDKYAFLIRTILLTSFYAPAMPFTLIYSALGLVFTYWTDKYILLRRIALPKSLNNELGNAMVEYLEWMAFMFAIGNFLFIYILQDSAHKDVFEDIPSCLIWITLGISLFHIYFPMGWLNKRLFGIKTNRNETQTYSEARFEFTTDYDIENPITRKKALTEFMFQVKGMIEMGAYNQNHMSTKEGAFTKLTMEDLVRLLNPQFNDDPQDFLFLERYAHEIGQSTILDRKRTITKLRMDLIRVLSKFDGFRKHHKKVIVQKFITNAKYSIGIKDYSEILSTEGNCNMRESFSKTGNHREIIFMNSYDLENRDETPKLENLNLRFAALELSRFADDRVYVAIDNIGDDESSDFPMRQEFAQRTYSIKNIVNGPLHKS